MSIIPKLSPDRRAVLYGGAAVLALSGLGVRPSSAETHTQRMIPSSGETIPVLGMGTSVTFNTGGDLEALDVRVEILRRFFAGGGRVIDSSPMYGTAEAVVGRCLARLGRHEGVFAATKVWTSSTDAGLEQMSDSERLWGIRALDLQQIHNLVNWRDHLTTLVAAKAEGRVRYIGITTSHGRRHDELETVLASEPLDFVQFTYNALDRDVEARLLPLAEDRGIAVIANRPFRRRGLIRLTEGAPMPGFAADLDCRTWAQLLLKFIVGHPGVTCVIPATSRPDHMSENLRAAGGQMPDATLRRRIAEAVESL